MLYIASYFEGKFLLLSYIGRNSLTILGMHWPLLTVFNRIEHKIYPMKEIPQYYGIVNTIAAVSIIIGSLYIINIVKSYFYK